MWKDWVVRQLGSCSVGQLQAAPIYAKIQIDNISSSDQTYFVKIERKEWSHGLNLLSDIFIMIYDQTREKQKQIGITFFILWPFCNFSKFSLFPSLDILIQTSLIITIKFMFFTSISILYTIKLERNHRHLRNID
jgi:hypothetical protein